MASQPNDILVPIDKYYVIKLDENCKYNDELHTTSFKIKNIPKDASIDMFDAIFQYCINIAIAETRKREKDPEEFCCKIKSRLLIEKDTGIGQEPVTDKTINANVIHFLNLNESVKKRSNVMLWSEPFTLNVETMALPDLKRKEQLTTTHHQINQRSLIKINNIDNINNLFMAMQATMVHATRRYKSQDFSRYMYSKQKFEGLLRREAIYLKLKINARPDQSNRYDATVWIPKIIDYWNELNKNIKRGHVFHAFIYESNHIQPSFDYGPTNYNTPIYLYHDPTTQHFDGVRNINKLFGKRHRNCRARCIKCSKMSRGLLRSCKPLLNYRTECRDCNKTFYNNICYQYHKNSDYCARSKECKECDVTYSMDENKEHQCSDNDSNNESDNEYINESDNEYYNESDNVSDIELNEESDNE